ncbi:hypothetical protein [Streptomyces sp. KN37]|uniref:hypothetical protein n=1 Tax=Streptomyces sp. KN37 TaxID=3090667 RepID=UPI002A762B50|nr:hypothetical protein [Streptomyces sp. KN37]WPO75415.1 hypothetical protein R9806_34885 [Streptomyces sp. KN37]
MAFRRGDRTAPSTAAPIEGTAWTDNEVSGSGTGEVQAQQTLQDASKGSATTATAKQPDDYGGDRSVKPRTGPDQRRHTGTYVLEKGDIWREIA